MRDIGVGIIGTGFMGKAHGFAYRAVAGIFPVKLVPVLEIPRLHDEARLGLPDHQVGVGSWRDRSLPALQSSQAGRRR